MTDYVALEASESRNSVDSACVGETKSITTTYEVPAAGVTFAASDTLALIKLPAEHVIVDAILDNEAIGAGNTADVGILDGTNGAALIAAADLNVAGVKRADVGGFTRIAPSGSEQNVGLTFSAGAAATGGTKVSLTVQYRAAIFGA